MIKSPKPKNLTHITLRYGKGLFEGKWKWVGYVYFNKGKQEFENEDFDVITEQMHDFIEALT